MIRRLLIANRGEVAVRIIRAAREMGIRSIAIYSEADRNARHVQLADEAWPLAGSEPRHSYLDIDQVVNTARKSGADAVHPGYGFLSERPEFPEALAEAGVRFVGPSPSAMRKLGSKAEAKALAVAARVPIVPGCFDLDATDDRLEAAAREIGYPVMLKASAGGGGRGMRIVRDAERFQAELDVARDEALKAFGDGAMMVEKLVERPRHIEVQVLADAHGQVACLFERECSLQRRHQKLVEESPSPYPGLNWQDMREASERLVRAADYVGAGTVEFIVDPATGAFYFLEVNARLQVEHPVTEAVTGVDLVQWQIRVAQGERLQLAEQLVRGDRTAINGHSIEVRIVAEDPATGFLPSTGRIYAWAEPQGPGIRVDTGFGPGDEVTRYYDSLLAKVIVHANTRSEAVSRIVNALEDLHVVGVRTNIGYLLDVLSHPEFLCGEFDTGFLSRAFGEWAPETVPGELGAILAHANPAMAERKQIARAWDLADNFRNSG